MPAFSFRHIKGEHDETFYSMLTALDLYPVFWDKACEVVEAMSGEARENDIIDVGPWASRVTLDIIGVAGMGHDFNSIKDPNGELSRCYKRVFGFSPSVAMQLVRNVLPFPPGGQPAHQAQPRGAHRAGDHPPHLQRPHRQEARGAGEGRHGARHPVGGARVRRLLQRQPRRPAHDVPRRRPRGDGVGDAVGLLPGSASTRRCRPACTPRSAKRLPSPLGGGRRQGDTSADVDGAPYLNAFCATRSCILPLGPADEVPGFADRDTTVLGQAIPQGHDHDHVPLGHQCQRGALGPGRGDVQPGPLAGRRRARAARHGGAGQQLQLSDLHPRTAQLHQGKNFCRRPSSRASWRRGRGGSEMRFEKDDYVLEVGGGVTSKPKGGLKVKMTPLEGW